MLHWEADEVRQAVAFKHWLSEAGLTKEQWESMSQAEQLVACGHGDEPIEASIGLHGGEVLLASGETVTLPGAIRRSYRDDLDAIIEAKINRKLEQDRLKRQTNDAARRHKIRAAHKAFETLVASGAARVPAACHCGMVHLTLGGRCPL